MIVQEAIKNLELALDFADQIDSSLNRTDDTDERLSTRHLCIQELTHFLLHIAGGCSIVNDAQAGLLSIVMGDDFKPIPTSEMKEAARRVGPPNMNRHLTLMTFQKCDEILAPEIGVDPVFSRLLLKIYEMFGEIMVAINENPVSRCRYETMIGQLRDRVLSDSADSDDSWSDSFASMTDDDFVIEDDVLTKYRAVTPADELYSHYGQLKRAADKFRRPGFLYVQENGEEHQALNLIDTLDSNGHARTNVYRVLKAAMSKDGYDLDQTALKIAQIFRVDESVFNSRHDDEGDIRKRLMDKKWKFSALRSFAWTLADLADREGKSIDDYDFDDLVAVCAFIEKREWLNYEGNSWFDGLCGHPDIHVFYMPGKMIDSGEADEICTLLSYSPITSLDAFRNDLSLLKNAMIKLHNGLLKTRNRHEKLDSPAAAVLQAWCVMAMSAKTPFFSEDGPMVQIHSYPSDVLNTSALPVGGKTAFITKPVPKPEKEEASSYMESVSGYEIVRGSDGKERVKLGEYPAGSPIIWLVLEKKGQEALLLSEFALDSKPFCAIHSCEGTTNEWHGCTLRAWLNEDFYDEAFSDDEQKMILDDTHDTSKKTADGIEETPDETDKVFLLSVNEVNQYFPNVRDRICRSSDYAKEQGVEIEGGPNQCSWWLRSPAVDALDFAGWAPRVCTDGSTQAWGIFSDDVGVRPVIRVKSEKFKSTGVSTATGKAGSKVSSTTAAGPMAEAQGIFLDLQSSVDNMLSQINSTSAAMEKHQKNLLKQKEDTERRMKEARKKGKSSHDEADMLAVLLIEEALGQLNRDEGEFAQLYDEDFAAYSKKQLIGLRKKVMPKIHNEHALEDAKQDMLARPLQDRFSISTANYFNVSTDWDFDAKGTAAIETTKLWYKESEMEQLAQMMEEHKENARQNMFEQLVSFHQEWSSFEGLKDDLHIIISSNNAPVPEGNTLFHVRQGRDVEVRIDLTNPALGYLSLPVMNIYPSCWKVSPEEIWDAALKNDIQDNREGSYSSRRDALAAKDAALAQLKSQAGSAQTTTDSNPAQKTATTPSQTQVATPVKPNAKRIRELEESIAALQAEVDSIGGLFGFIKKNKLMKEIEAQQRELETLKSHLY